MTQPNNNNKLTLNSLLSITNFGHEPDILGESYPGLCSHDLIGEAMEEDNLD